MTIQKNFPVCIESPSGLKFELNANGSIRRMDCGDIMLNLFLGNEMEGGPANIYLRRKGQRWRPYRFWGRAARHHFRSMSRG